MTKAKALVVMMLTEDATAAEVKARYHALAAERHPDKGGDVSAFVELNEAYQTLRRAIKPRRCGLCHGSGKETVGARGFQTIRRRCPRCHGKGRLGDG